MFKMKELIYDTYGSIDKMLEVCDTFLSRAYLYKLVSGEYKNPSLIVVIELKNLLHLKSLEDVAFLLGIEA